MTNSSFIKNYHNQNSLYINPDRKWLWLRIHKTAGTSIYSKLQHDCINLSKGKHQLEAKQWINTISEEEIKNYLIWSFVRNPYDRFMSMATMFSVDPNRFAKEFHSIRDRKEIIQRHTLPQHLYTHHEGKSMLTYTFKVENIQDHFDFLCDKIRIPKTELPHLNKTEHEPWRKVFNGKTIKFINEYFELDFQYFNYKMIDL